MAFENGKGFSRRVAFAVLQQMAAFATKDGKYGRFVEVLVGVTALHLSTQPAATQDKIVADIVKRANAGRAELDTAQALVSSLSADGTADEMQGVQGLADNVLAKIISQSKEV